MSQYEHPIWVPNQPLASDLTLACFPSVAGSVAIFFMYLVEQDFIFIFFFDPPSSKIGSVEVHLQPRDDH